MAYSSGDMVVHPRHGVATVVGTPTRGAGASRTSYLSLAFASPDLEIIIPLDSVADVGIRPLLTAEAAAALLDDLGQDAEVPSAWADRRSTTTTRLQTTQLAEASLVVRDLTRHEQRSGKPLSHSEKAVLTACLDRVSAELALVLEMSQDDARSLILERVAARA